jgi:hypothetical protein
MGGGAWPFLVGGAICLVNSVNERDLNLLNSRAYLLLVGQQWSVGGRLSIRAIPKLGTGGRGPLRSTRRRQRRQCGSPAGPTPESSGPGLGVLVLLRGTVVRIANGSLRQ